MNEIPQCEICGAEADGSCQNCGNYVCFGCSNFVKWGPSDEQIRVCDNCRDTLEDYDQMNIDEFSENFLDPFLAADYDAPVYEADLACSRCGRLETFQILWDERDALEEYQERLPYVCSICSPTGNAAWFDGFDESDQMEEE